ncbi:methylated-DNA--[protein]-cysteine S-methyltransferase [Pusillimonas sp.]|uniref:methylated-DNA--[protein]-cysteine S-methyltransferase n=1 Tax=Pusillimonas sp. TaxID=3040095 RepID=UPI0037CB6B78
MLINRKSGMYRARIDSPFGPVLLCGAEKGLAGLYFLDQKDCPPLPGGPAPRSESQRPGSGELGGVALRALHPVRRSSGQDGLHEQLALFSSDGGAALSHGEAGQAISGEQATQNGRQVVGTRLKHRAAHTEAPELLQGDTPAEVSRLFDCVWVELQEYFSGSRKNFDLPLDLAGTPFQVKVWRALCRVPHGELVSYGELAAMAGLTRGHGRAVGAAVGRNPVSIVVPCHRIIGSNRTLTGYTGGLWRKLALLELEGFGFV